MNSGCVEVKFLDDVVLVRNSTDETGSVTRCTSEEWAVFVEGVKAGEFDR